jgi:hypothetical protein
MERSEQLEQFGHDYILYFHFPMNHTTLDPASHEEWREFSTLAHTMLDDMLAHLASLADKPAW